MKTEERTISLCFSFFGSDIFFFFYLSHEQSWPTFDFQSNSIDKIHFGILISIDLFDQHRMIKKRTSTIYSLLVIIRVPFILVIIQHLLVVEHNGLSVMIRMFQQWWIELILSVKRLIFYFMFDVNMKNNLPKTVLFSFTSFQMSRIVCLRSWIE